MESVALVKWIIVQILLKFTTNTYSVNLQDIKDQEHIHTKHVLHTHEMALKRE